MSLTPFDQRPSGIPAAGELPWGSHFCVFYASSRELLEVLVPFIRAGLESNELCLWEVREPLTMEEVRQALAECVPDFERYLAAGQIEIVPAPENPEGLGRGDEALERRLDGAILAGFDGLRLVRYAVGSDGEPSVPGADVIRRLNVIAAFVYPRAELRAVGLMQVVQGHRFAVVHNSGRWEVLEGSEARIARDELERSEKKLRSLFRNMSEGFAYHRIVLDAQGKPCDYVFLEVNAAFERLTGLRAEEILGKRVTQVLPGIEADPTDWIASYGRVALTGQPTHFESHLAPLDRWYAISAFSAHKGYFVVTFADITDRKRAEAERRAAEERLSVTLRSIGDAVIATDTEGRVTLLNRIAESLTGWTQSEALGKRLDEIFRIVNQDTGAPAENPVRKVLAQGGVVGLANHTALISRDGRRIAIADSAAPVRAVTGGILGVVLVFRDVTVERRAERERDLTIEFLRLVNANDRTADLMKAAVSFLQQHSGSGAVGIRLTHGDDFPYYQARGFSKEFLRLENQICARDSTGAVCRDSAGNPVMDCMCGSVVSGRFDPAKPFFTGAGSFWTNSTTELLATATEVDGPTRLRNRCQGEGYESVALVPLRLGDERLGLVQLNDRQPGKFSLESVALWERLSSHLAVAVARSRAEEARCASEARFKLLADTAGLLLAAEHPQLLVNRLCREIMAHLDCHVFFNYLVDRSAGRLRLNAYGGISQKEAERIEWLDIGRAICGCVARDGQPIVAEDIQQSADPCADLVRSYGIQAYCAHPLVAQGQVIGTLSFGTMTRARFSTEDVVLMKTVADQVAVAMQRVQAQEDLQVANTLLLESDRRKDEFLAMLSHELRNPLTPIRNSLFMLDRVPPGGEQAKRAQAIMERQVGHLARLVDDLLDVTRIRRGKVQIQREQLELGDLVRRTIEDHRQTFVANGIQLEGRLSSESMWLHADATRLAQVVGNLLGNAVKFTPYGGRVDITLERDGDSAVLQVHDNGEGIDPEVLGSLFQPFSQAQQTLARTHGGLGLGLALVKGLVELHGGTAQVTSKGLGQGAEVTVRLPLGLAPAQGDAPLEIRRRQRRLLIIEDNVDAADSLKLLLELLGHEVAVAYDGISGIEAARDSRPEMLLCDIGLPVMDGYEVARCFRADPVLQEVVLVALSGYALPEDRQRAMEAGYAHHVAKPPSLEVLESLLASD